jgi:nitroreductase
METRKAIESRRAVRDFDAKPVPADVVERVLEAGRRAPSSMNEQRWDFILCSDSEHLVALSKVGDYAGHLAGAAFGVALVVPVAEEVWRKESIAFDLGQAAENMMIAAWDLGIGSVHASVYDEDMARELLGYPTDRRCDTILSFGYPKDPGVLELPPSGGRKPLSEILHMEHW